MSQQLDELHLLHAIRLAAVATDTGGTITFANDAAAALYGGTRSELVGRHLADFLRDSADQERLHADLPGLLAGGLWRGEVPVRRLSGDAFVARIVSTPRTDATGSVLGLVIVSEDITEIRSVEAARDASDLRLRLALEAAQLGTWHWDATTGRNIWDARLEAMYGLPPGGFDQTWDGWMALIHPEDRADVVATVITVWSHPAPYLVKSRIVWPDGRTVRCIEAWGHVTTDEQGRPTGTIGCVRDVTRERETEDALAVARGAELLASRRTALLLAVTADLAGVENLIEVRRAMEHHLEQFIAEIGDEAQLALPPALRSVRTGADLAAGYDRLAVDDRTILDSLATQCVSAVHRVELMTRTGEIAESLQVGLAASPLPDEHEGMEIAVRCTPGGDELEHVGGDWYDVVRTHEGHLAVVVGDVMGRGVRASITMVRVRAALRGLTTLDPTPETLLAFADDVLERDAPDQFVTAVAALLDPRTREMRLCLAGHVPVILVHPEGRTELLGEASGIPLGVEPDVVRHGCRVAIPPGGTVILVTDGVVESRTHDLDEGLDRLRERASALRDGSLEDLVDGLAALADDSMGDDVTVLAIRMR